MVERVSLSGRWTLQAAGDLAAVPEIIGRREIEAMAPGCVHTDLLAAGLIEDPYLDRNEEKVQWIGRTDWQYSRTFDVAEEALAYDNIELVCEGLDTVAQLRLNGQVIGETANMHLGYRFDVKSLLQAEQNQLTITFTSALRYAEMMRDRLGDLPHVQEHPFNFIRKMACNFGWDWGPTLITAGIWQPIYLQAWHTARIETVRPLVSQANADEAVVDVIVEVARAANTRLRVTATLTGPAGETVGQETAAVAAQASQAALTCRVSRPALWWPRGYGAQPLYALAITLATASEGPGSATETALDEWNGRIGLRTARLNSEPDEVGTQFTIEVNGRPIFCKGADWIPDDCFPTRVDEARYGRRLEQATAANMNMLRVWGGGIYENEVFYRLCDELGLMVWQDFLFACAAYPEEAPFPDLVAAEARYHIARLSQHASLVLWNGCNENIWGYFDWGWQARLKDRAWGLGYYLDLLPRLVQALDPTRSYWPASPYSGTMDIHPNNDNHGNTHLWTVWHGGNYPIYRQHRPRFCSEFGFQGPANYATWQRALPAEQRFPGSPTMHHHQKSPGGDEKNERFLADFFTVPEGLADWIYLLQLNQARALATGVTWFRSRQPICMGMLYWQLNDCWPATSWAAIDGDGRLKLLWYATRRFYADRLLTIQPEEGQIILLAHNDSDQPWQDTMTLMRRNFDGQKLAVWQSEVDAPPRSCVRVLELTAFTQPDDPAREFLLAATADQQRAFWFFDVDKNLAYPEPRFTAVLAQEGSSHRLTMTAETLLRDIALFPEILEPRATVNEQLVTLLPDESFTFVIESERPFTLEELISPPIFQCVNRFGQT
jgi:beta-mannosidase